MLDVPAVPVHCAGEEDRQLRALGQYEVSVVVDVERKFVEHGSFGEVAVPTKGPYL